MVVKIHELPASFEEGITKLESLITEMESDRLSLDQALAHYQQGVELLRFCEDKLAAVEQQLRILDGDTLKPFDTLKSSEPEN